ncbi:hypothetical protein D3C75_158510 [compost metagenome]
MAWSTPVTNWTEARPVGVSDLNRIESNIKHLVTSTGLYGITAGTASIYTVTIAGLTELVEGVKITVKLHVNNAASPQINVNNLGTVVIRKANGNPVPAGNLKLNSVYTLVYNGSAFILQGEGGGGTAKSEHVLAPYTFTNEDGSDQVGTLPTITSSADPAQGVGQWPDGGLAVYPTRGYRKGGAGEGEIKVTPEQLRSAEPSLRGPYILAGHNIYGTEGSMPNRSSQGAYLPAKNSTVWSGDRVFLQPQDGWYDGSTWVTAPVPDLVASNIRHNRNILGITGNLVPGGEIYVVDSTSWPGGDVHLFNLPGGTRYAKGAAGEYSSSPFFSTSSIYCDYSLRLYWTDGNGNEFNVINYANGVAIQAYNFYFDGPNRRFYFTAEWTPSSGGNSENWQTIPGTTYGGYWQFPANFNMNETFSLRANSSRVIRNIRMMHY